MRRFELGEAPRGTGLLRRARIDANGEADDEVVQRGRILSERCDHGDDLGELVGVLEIGGEEAVVSGGSPHRLGVAGEAGDPYRDAGSLRRPGKELDVVDRVVVAVVVNGLTAPGGGEDLQRLVEHLAPGPVVELLAGLRELASEAVTRRCRRRG